MNSNCDYMTSYKAAHKYIPSPAFESNVSVLK